MHGATYGPGPIAVPDWLTEIFGPASSAAVRLRWGFRNETWAGHLPDGRQVAATRLFDPDFAATLAARIASIRPRLAEVGIPVPPLVETQPPPPDGVLLTGFVRGTPGAEIFGRAGGAPIVGTILGATWRRMGEIATTDLELHDLWTSGVNLAAAAREWSADIAPDLAPPDRVLLGTVVAELPGLLQDRPVAMVHGDLVPVNILIDDGRLVALLDLEAVRLADPILDAAWFRWIVWYHHPREEPAAWTAFAAEAGLDLVDPVTAGLMQSYPIIRLLEILDGIASGDPARQRWLAQLAAALDRTHAGGRTA